MQFGSPVPVGTNEVTVIDAGATSRLVTSRLVMDITCAMAPGPGSGVYIDANYHVQCLVKWQAMNWTAIPVNYS